MSADPWVAGLASGWRVSDASSFDAAFADEADVIVIGSGAGGGVAADVLSQMGLKLIIVEEGPLVTSRDFHMTEAAAYPALYQESAARKTRDHAISMLQGRCVGGGTTVNWTSSFRTPPSTLDFWRERLGLQELGVAELAPWFEKMESRLGVAAWTTAPNANNGVLARGAARLGIPTASIPRNVKGCADLGYCGMGCPIDAKQSMLVTTLPSALATGARLYTRLRAERLVLRGDRVEAVDCVAVDSAGRARPVTARLHARHYLLAAGGIGSPALLLRSGAPDPHARLGRRTFLHPTVVCAALMPDTVGGYAGAPQSVYSDHFLKTQAIDGPLGFKLEVPPLHPVLFATTLQGHGQAHAAIMREFTRVHAMIALLRDGFHEASAGGVVGLRDDGSPLLDYPLTDLVWEGARRALAVMAEIQFAAGASRVYAVHEDCAGWDSWAEARAGIAALSLAPLLTRVVSAHVMGGCGMGAGAKDGVVNAHGAHFQLENLSVCDASLFPTSIGANPQLSIFALAARNASRLAAALGAGPRTA